MDIKALKTFIGVRRFFSHGGYVPPLCLLPDHLIRLTTRSEARSKD